MSRESARVTPPIEPTDRSTIKMRQATWERLAALLLLDTREREAGGGDAITQGELIDHLLQPGLAAEEERHAAKGKRRGS